MTLRSLGLLGFLLFASVFYLTYSLPGYIEDIGKSFIQNQIREKTEAKIDSLKVSNSETALGKLAAKLYAKNKNQIDFVKQKLKDKAHEKLADVIAEMRDLDCECRNKWAAKIKQEYELELKALQVANEKIKNFMRIKYMEVVTELTRDVRIFTGVNALVFLLLLVISFLKPQAVSHLFLPGLLLLVSTSICTFFYIFEQNWLLTIIYSDYPGYSYLAYVGILFLFLCDIVLNYARITTAIINGILEGIGSAASVAPC